ncbi:MAG: hypothetical protein JWM10_3131 [Myxococcaceae bacterium]|nr:hypothetical protein [Myxococcaceae bacterium]
MRQVAFLTVAVLLGCAAYQRGEGLDVESVPAPLRADYELFARRCSRCHSLSRPLNARISSEEHWREYVNRMRRMPSSGIAADEVPGLLRFLTWYSAARRSPDGGVGGSR